ncbi:MAG: ATP-binding cassette domain-containing protein [Desulfurellaceae bacterium]|nr:ATP-binding cassette domain-containing protein [Desulfurellaceae bacterium]
MLQLINLSLAFGGQELFRNLNWHIRKGDRVGLVGPNGAGKTTLFRLLTGQLEPDTGRVQHGRDLSIGYLPQEGIDISGRDLFAETRSALPELTALQQELETIQAALDSADGTASETLAQEGLIVRYGDIHHRIEELDGFQADAQVAKVLTGLGFHEAQFTARTETFSGGWQMRIALAKLLLQQPDVLLLDEPTNHLDLDSLLWLESYLHNYRGSIVIVSHDRAFLDRMVNRVVALHRSALTEYTGNYSTFERVFEEHLESYRKTYDTQQEEIERLTRFINTFRYNARKAPQVQSRVKQLEKMEKLDPPQTVPKGVRFHFPQAPRSGRRVIELQRVSKCYDSVQVFENLDLVIERGDRVAVVGVNGAGKSTLSRILSGVEGPTSGSRQLGHQVVLDYYAQQQAERLQTNNTVYEEIVREAATDVVPQLRTLLGAFLFSGDAIEKRVAVLSGGEKSRLALAKMLLQASNLLILDEPTNHLDIHTKDIVKEALLQYEGTFVVVSHDRYFLSGLVTKVLELQDGYCTTYPGTFEEFLERKERQTDSSPPQEQVRLQSVVQRVAVASPTASAAGIEGTLAAIREAKHGKLSYQQQKAARAERQKRAKRLAALEQHIATLEDHKEKLERRLADEKTFQDREKAREVTGRYEQVKQQLDEQYAEWTALAEEHESD